MILQAQTFHHVDINVVVPTTKRFASPVKPSLPRSLASAAASETYLQLSPYQYGSIPNPQDRPLYRESTTPRLPISPNSCFIPLKPSKGSTGTLCSSPLSSSTSITSRSSSVPSLGSQSSSMASENTFNVSNPPQNISFCQVIAETSHGRNHNLGSTSPTPSLSSISSSSYSTTNRRPKSPRENNESVRRNRVKTELCMHYANNNPCPFGAGCTYAHGEEELQLTKLMDLHRAGLADVETYRTKPCITWVSTGSCPFGIRCTGIHDPRVVGTQSSWLPHTETQGNTIDTDINVESLHQKRLNAMLHNNPFGEQFSLDLDNYEDLYKLICNQTKIKRKRSALSDRHKIEIALKMRGNSDWQFKFRPQHIIYDEVCMVLQKRAFRLTADGAVEIPLRMFSDGKVDHVIVREIAFGPDSDTAVRPVSLLFNITDHDVTVCTQQQAKRYRYKRNPKNADKIFDSKKTSSLFENKDSFAMIRPLGKDVFDFCSDVLHHRLEYIKANTISNLSARAAALEVLNDENLHLKTIFENLRRQWVTWSWPMNRDNGKVNENTPAPKVDTYYSFENSCTSSDTVLPVTDKIWESFIETNVAHAHSRDQNVKRKRLPIFNELSEKKAVNHPSGFLLPHITPNRRGPSSQNSDLPIPARQSERCWKALLLNKQGIYETNEWEMVKHHFANCRSKKVLTILQQ